MVRVMLESMTLLNRWIGVVRSIDEDAREFTATYRDQTQRTYPEEEGTFKIDDLCESDRCELALGSVFYWTIGYAYKGATKRKFSEIHLKRVKELLPNELQRAKIRADDYWNLFNSDN